jgi:hypothetical protein
MCRSYPALPVCCQPSASPTTTQTKGQLDYEPDIVQLFTACRSRQLSGHSGRAMEIVQGLKLDSVSAIVVLLVES